MAGLKPLWISGVMFLGGAALLLAQSGAGVRPVGVVTAIDGAAGRITLKTDAGPEMRILFGEATRFLRVAPGAQDLTGALAMAPSELSVGDRILVRGRSAADANSLAADSIIVMSRVELAKKHAAERADWEQRGIGGVITARNPASAEITIRVQTGAGARTVAVALAPGAALRRYAPDSVRFSDARPSRFEELKIGDQIRARGTSSPDRTRFTAEELVSGSFRDLAATVVGVDTSRNIVQITDLATKRRLQVRASPDSVLRRLSPSVVQMIAARVSGAGSPAASPGERVERAGERGGQAVSPGRQSYRDLQTMIEALPALSLADLTPGEAIVLSCTNSEDPSQVTAITLLAGVEPLLWASSRGGRGPDIGSWNLDLNMNIGVP